MSYKALLFCPDEKTVQVVTQVLNELDFTVQRSSEPFATVKRLTDEHFDALVVDCQNEQDASLLFKGARNSSFNHSSLYVAVVEGQTGVAKAFRIGANLVLTKPINIEQSKGTLRVARGLLRKNEARQAAAASLNVQSPALPANLATAAPVIQPPAHPTPASFAMIEVEQDPTPAPEAAEAAVLESIPDPMAAKPSAAEHTWQPALKSSAEPIAASTAGQAAAVALAPVKPVPELKTAPPLATQESIVADAGLPDSFDTASVPVPTFSSYGSASSEAGSGRKMFRKVAVLLICIAAGYLAWQRLQPLQYLPHVTRAAKQPEAAPAVNPAPAVTGADRTPAGTASETPTPAAPPLTTSNFTAPPEMIHVDEGALPPEPKITVVPKPLVVKTKPASAVPEKPAPLAPPSLAISPTDNSAIANLVSTKVAVPKVATGSVRVSQGVSQGLLMKKVPPAYPPIALQLRKQGAVELLASVNKDGTITGVKVLSGDSVLAKSAVEAVRQWKYRPYLLNGEPVEIETQITINFRLPN
jgi:protein TonB